MRSADWADVDEVVTLFDEEGEGAGAGVGAGVGVGCNLVVEVDFVGSCGLTMFENRDSSAFCVLVVVMVVVGLA